MKKTIALLLMAIPFLSMAQPDSSALARVNKRDGIEVYVMSDPLKPYSVTGKVTADDFASIWSGLNGKHDDRTITQMIDVLIKNALRKKEKGKLDFDAILTEDGKSGTLVKFKG